MRAITVSTDVYARIWALRLSGEETEDAILRRVLDVADPSGAETLRTERGVTGGFYDVRHRVAFPEGFEIFRTYKGQEFRAVAQGGSFRLLNDGSRHGGLNELSKGIGTKVENAWANWFFLNERNERCPVSALRDPVTVASRTRSAQPQSEEADVDPPTDDVRQNQRWVDDIAAALQSIGGSGHLNQIYEQVTARRRLAGRSIPTTLKDVVRARLEENCSHSDAFRGGPDLFVMVEGKGAGIWGLRSAE